MNKYTKSLLIFTMFAATTACTFHTSKQNPEKAAASAVEFSKAAFVERDVDKAFSLLDPEFQSYATKEKFGELIQAMNSPISPAKVTAMVFEPIPGQEGVTPRRYKAPYPVGFALL
jgi:acetylornithine/succinyldiaminopimelate/putrescine aminotransferase